MLCRTVVTLCTTALLSCAVAVTQPDQQPERVPTGKWSGPHAVLEVTSDGALVEYDCARGTVDEPLVLSSQRKFAVKGTYTQEQPGPERVDQPAAARAARYEGELINDVLTLTVTVSDPDETLGPFTLKRDAAGVLRKCR
jgi:hypothetical protein